MKVKIAAAILVSLVLAHQIVSGELIPLIVLSGSMVPYMYPGDIIFVKKVDPEGISVGDVICFKDPSGRKNVLITHRVVNVTKIGGELIFKTKGDALEEEDAFNVTERDVVGTPVLLIPMLGYLHEKKEFVYFSMILLPSVVVLLSEIRVVLNPKLSERFEEKSRRRKLKTSRRETVSWKRVAATVAVFYLILFALLLQEYVPVQKVVIENGKVSIPENVDPYRAYYLIPPFYVEMLYKINPVLPNLGIVLYPLFTSLLLSPLWKSVRRRKRWSGKQRFSSSSWFW